VGVPSIGEPTSASLRPEQRRFERCSRQGDNQYDDAEPDLSCSDANDPHHGGGQQCGERSVINSRSYVSEPMHDQIVPKLGSTISP
jgi:hypothetical protein